MRRARCSLVALVAGVVGAGGACNDPPLALRFRVTSNPAGQCLSAANAKLTTCSDVTMLCRAVVSIRVFNPDDSTAPYISVCKELTGQPNLCAIAGVDLPTPTQPLTEQTLAVEMVVFPYDPSMKDPVTGELQCPTGVQFDGNGFPQSQLQPCAEGTVCPPTPAVGGLAYYHPGDAETVVDLGCTDLAQLNAATCANRSIIHVNATVSDFDTEISVQPSLADRLSVAVGEPESKVVGTETHYFLNSAKTTPLARTKIQPVPGWSVDLDTSFVADACLEVVEDGAQVTTAITCRPASSKLVQLDMSGTRLAKSTLSDILGALSQPAFPDNGLVIGIVLDYLGNPVENATVSTSAGTAVYLSADRKNLIAGGTSASGMFVSTDAPFRTTFSASSGLLNTAGFGGLVDGKATIVVLQFATPVGN